MRKPKMILFDYGQTLADEHGFDSIAGFNAVLQYAVKNKYHYTAEDILAKWNEVYAELGEFDPQRRFEIPNSLFFAYLFPAMGIELSCTPQEVDRIYWQTASPSVATEGAEEFLAFLKEQNIRTGVISNIMASSQVLEERIKGLFPEHNFEFILATSDYMFKKPNKRIFDLALEKADLQPEDVWYIGNSYRCDVGGARSAGIYPVWYIGATSNPQGEGDVYTISCWTELQQELKRIF